MVHTVPKTFFVNTSVLRFHSIAENKFKNRYRNCFVIPDKADKAADGVHDQNVWLWFSLTATLKSNSGAEVCEMLSLLQHFQAVGSNFIQWLSQLLEPLAIIFLRHRKKTTFLMRKLLLTLKEKIIIQRKNKSLINKIIFNNRNNTCATITAIPGNYCEISVTGACFLYKWYIIQVYWSE